MMAYDWFLAVCRPLHYAVVMTLESCSCLDAYCWFTTVCTVFLPCLMVSRPNFCNYNLIDHFFCDISLLLKLSCSDATITEAVIFIRSLLVLSSCFLLTLLSYIFIIFSILKIPSASGKRRTFSTCSSHVMVVTTYYSAMMSMYLCLVYSLIAEINKAASVLYTVPTPLFKPIIYGMRNKAFKEAFGKILFRHNHAHS